MPDSMRVVVTYLLFTSSDDLSLSRAKINPKPAVSAATVDAQSGFVMVLPSSNSCAALATAAMIAAIPLPVVFHDVFFICFILLATEQFT